MSSSPLTHAQVAITVYCQDTEVFRNGVASCVPKHNSLQLETAHYNPGLHQQFCLPSHTVDPSEWAEEELCSDLHREVYQWWCLLWRMKALSISTTVMFCWVL